MIVGQDNTFHSTTMQLFPDRLSSGSRLYYNEKGSLGDRNYALKTYTFNAIKVIHRHRRGKRKHYRI